MTGFQQHFSGLGDGTMALLARRDDTSVRRCVRCVIWP